MTTVVVLGSGGFLAGYVERLYREAGWRVVSIGRSVQGRSGQGESHAWALPHPDFGHLLATIKPTLCVNTAGRASVGASLIEPLADFDANASLVHHLLDAVRRSSPTTAFVHLSSAAVYGDPTALPVSETADIAPISPYGWNKRISEMAVEQYARQFGLRAASLRIFSAYGLGLQRQVIYDLVSRACANPDVPLRVFGDPQDSRDFIHGADVAKAVQAIANRGDLEGECYNVASGVETPIAEVAALILQLLGRAEAVQFDEHRPTGNPGRWHASIDRLKQLGFAPSISLKDGLRPIIEQVRTNAPP